MKRSCTRTTAQRLCGVLWLAGSLAAQAPATSGTTSPATAPAAQSGPIVTTPEVLNFDALRAQAADLLKQAAAGNGSAGTTLAQYHGHYTMLTARTKSGGGEVHKKFSDFLFVLDGEGTELTGGTVVDSKEGANGETRGSRLEGATPHALHKGDVIHIPAGTPHQAIQAPGQSIVIFVIKVQEPDSSAS